MWFIGRLIMVGIVIVSVVAIISTAVVALIAVLKS
jgi:hypothetical protein